MQGLPTHDIIDPNFKRTYSQVVQAFTDFSKRQIGRFLLALGELFPEAEKLATIRLAATAIA